MSRKKIERSLRRAVEDLPRPGFDAVSAPPVQQMEVHDYITRQEGPNPMLRRRRIARAAGALCLLALVLGVTSYLQFFQIYSTVELRVNPHFSISMNRQDQVRTVDGVNDDAQEILTGRSYRGWTLEATVNSLMDELALGGYLSGGDDVDVMAASKALPHAQELRAEVEALVAAKRAGLSSAEPAPSATPAPITPEPTATTPAAPTPSAPAPTPAAPKPSSSTPAPSQPAASPTPSQPQLLSADAASQVALAQFPGARIDKIKLDEDDGVWYYEVELIEADEKIELEIDAYTGEILRWEYD